jgi:putative hemin transport protein
VALRFLRRGREYGDQLAQLDAPPRGRRVARRGDFDGYRGEHRTIEVGIVPAVLDHV